MSSDLVERLRAMAARCESDGALCERDDLREAADIIEKLPVTADGVPVVPPVVLWFPVDDDRGAVDHDIDDYEELYWWTERGRVSELYSTEAAALAAASPSPTQGH